MTDLADMRQVRLRAEALESLLVERGLLRESDVDQVIEQFERRVGPMNGAEVVARSWTMRTSSAACLRTARRPLVSSVFRAAKSTSWWS